MLPDSNHSVSLHFTLLLSPMSSLHWVLSFINMLMTLSFILHSASDMMAKLCNIKQCSNALYNWFWWNGLTLDRDKMEVLLLGSATKLCHINCTNAANIAGADISLIDSVKSLGVTIDSRLTNLLITCQASYFHIPAWRHVRGSMSSDIVKSIAITIVCAWLDYCNSLLYGVSAANLNKLQRVQNTLARVITGTKNRDHMTLVLQALHWLLVNFRITYKITILMCKVFIRVHSTFDTLA